jgi:hypothetical protein
MNIHSIVHYDYTGTIFKICKFSIGDPLNYTKNLKNKISKAKFPIKK